MTCTSSICIHGISKGCMYSSMVKHNIRAKNMLLIVECSQDLCFIQLNAKNELRPSTGICSSCTMVEQAQEKNRWVFKVSEQHERETAAYCTLLGACPETVPPMPLLTSSGFAMTRCVPFDYYLGRILKRDDFSEIVDQLMHRTLQKLHLMHSSGVFHRDVKVHNLVLIEEDNQGLRFIDFDLAVTEQTRHNKTQKANDRKGYSVDLRSHSSRLATRGYRCPTRILQLIFESFVGKQPEPPAASASSRGRDIYSVTEFYWAEDVWELGVTWLSSLLVSRFHSMSPFYCRSSENDCLDWSKHPDSKQPNVFDGDHTIAFDSPCSGDETDTLCSAGSSVVGELALLSCLLGPPKDEENKWVRTWADYHDCAIRWLNKDPRNDLASYERVIKFIESAISPKEDKCFSEETLQLRDTVTKLLRERPILKKMLDWNPQNRPYTLAKPTLSIEKSIAPIILAEDYKFRTNRRIEAILSMLDETCYNQRVPLEGLFLAIEVYDLINTDARAEYSYFSCYYFAMAFCTGLVGIPDNASLKEPTRKRLLTFETIDVIRRKLRGPVLWNTFYSLVMSEVEQLFPKQDVSRITKFSDKRTYRYVTSVSKYFLNQLHSLLLFILDYMVTGSYCRPDRKTAAHLLAQEWIKDKSDRPQLFSGLPLWHQQRFTTYTKQIISQYNSHIPDHRTSFD